MQEHSRIHLAVYHPSVSLQSFLCSAASRSSDNPKPGNSSSDVQSLMLLVNPEQTQKNAALLCSEDPRTHPQIPACGRAANRLLSGAADRKRQRIQRSVTRHKKTILGSSGLNTHPRKQHLQNSYLQVAKRLVTVTRQGVHLISNTPKPKIISRN